MSTKIGRYLPGDKPKKAIIDEIIRVDHSGEHGAKKIYAGQILGVKHLKALSKILGRKKQYDNLLHKLQEMYDGEVLHHEYFTKIMSEMRTRPSFFLPLWSLLGFIGGYITSLAGQETAMTCTVGVEDVIGEHYEAQLKEVGILIKNNRDQPQGDALLQQLSVEIKKFMHDEVDHLNSSIDWGAQNMCGHFYFKMLIKSITKIAIIIAKEA